MSQFPQINRSLAFIHFRVKILCISAIYFTTVLGYAQFPRHYLNNDYKQTLDKEGIRQQDPIIKDTEIKLPVTLALAFHVVYQKADKRPITKEDIVAQIDVLINDFNGKTFQNSAHTKHLYAHLATDTEITFCPRFSVDYTTTDSTVFKGLQSVKSSKTGGVESTQPDKIINIWICDLASGAGYAQLPGYPIITDGIVIDKDYFGTRETQKPPYDKGKTLTHLMGNYLGLMDLWGWGSCEDDDVADTPTHSAPSLYAGRAMSLCYRYVVYQMDINFMDNTPDSELSMFTKGQKEKMHQELKTRRNLLIRSEDCIR